LDHAVSWFTSGLLAVPSFLLAVILLYVFSVRFGWFPITGWEPWSSGVGTHLRRTALPTAVLALDQSVLFIRVLRSDMIATLREDFALAARARGLTTRRVLLAHALRPSLFSLVTVLGVSVGRLLGGTVIVESVFGLPGLGNYLVTAVGSQDFVPVQGVVLVVAVAYVLINSLVDATYPLLDPRVRTART
jgi:peptide/nickel transport system permease protein